MANKSVVWQEKTVSGYDELYPKTIDTQVIINDEATEKFNVPSGGNLGEVLENIPNKEDAGLVEYKSKLYRVVSQDDNILLGSQTILRGMAGIGRDCYACFNYISGSSDLYAITFYRKDNGEIIGEPLRTDASYNEEYLINPYRNVDNLVLFYQNGRTHKLVVANCDSKKVNLQINSGGGYYQPTRYGGIKNNYVYFYYTYVDEENQNVIRFQRANYETMVTDGSYNPVFNWGYYSSTKIRGQFAKDGTFYSYAFSVSDGNYYITVIDFETKTRTTYPITGKPTGNYNFGEDSILWVDYDTNEAYCSFPAQSTRSGLFYKINLLTRQLTVLSTTIIPRGYVCHIDSDRVLVNINQYHSILRLSTMSIERTAATTIGLTIATTNNDSLSKNTQYGKYIFRDVYVGASSKRVTFFDLDNLTLFDVKPETPETSGGASRYYTTQYSPDTGEYLFGYGDYSGEAVQDMTTRGHYSIVATDSTLDDAALIRPIYGIQYVKDVT